MMETIKKLISEGKTDEAIRLLDKFIENNPSSDEAYFLRGNAFRKKEMFKEAMNNYLLAIEINADSPASIAYQHTISIMEFYNKDLYNP